MCVMNQDAVGISPEQLKQKLVETKNRINNTALYFELRKRKLIRGNQSLENIKTVIAMVKLHIPITTYAFNWATGKNNGLSVLHDFGDKHLLVWKRGDSGVKGTPFEWLISPYLADLMAYIWSE